MQNCHQLREAFQDVEDWTNVQIPKAAFLDGIDGLRDPLHAAALAAYEDDYYAKLLTLKTLNLLVGRYHYEARHSAIAAHPFTLMVDPVNACQLKCPGCVHSENQAFVQGLQWPSGSMSVEAFRQLLDGHGPTALNTVLYNYGEPLLNKRFPEFVSLAHEYGMTTHVSTNLSLPIDAEKLVRAAPDHMILSIDGISQETYGKYRKGGKLATVLRNVEALVDWKRRLNRNRPILVWRFFPFSHNVHEAEPCVELARDLGVDQVVIGRPFDVSNDDPEIRSVDFELKGRRIDISDRKTWSWRPESILMGIRRHESVERQFDRGFSTMLSDFDRAEPSRPNAPTCRWLYSNVTVDAVGRVMPCCISPSDKKALVYGELAADSAGRWLDSEFFRAARESLAERSEARAPQPQSIPEQQFHRPYCGDCRNKPPMTYGVDNAVRDLGVLDFRGVLVAANRDFWGAFPNWH